MNTVYIITGAAGHLGGTIIRQLEGKDVAVRGLILPDEIGEKRNNISYYKGDVTKPETLDNIFIGTENCDVTVIHVAGLISISGNDYSALYNVNVTGTRNIIAKCREYKIKRLVYVSTVHAIPEQPDGTVISEVKEYSERSVNGAYAKTKALASEFVMKAVEEGLDAVIVQPSGILGPYDDGRNHMVQLIKDYVFGKIPAGVKGGYDFVDVRDVADGCILAAEKGTCGESYILSNRYCTIGELFGYIRQTVRGTKKPCVPMFIAKAAAPIIEYFAKKLHKRPLFTRYSLRTLESNGVFSHGKASAELGFAPRDLKVTVADTINWLKLKKLPSV